MIRFVWGCIGLVCVALSVAAKDYKGAELYSKANVKYGKFEIRMKLASAGGVISSFFLYYNNSYLGGSEPWEEIDIEAVGSNPGGFQTNLITGTAASKVTSEKFHNCVSNISQAYHTFTIEWTPDYISWFFDGSELRKTTGNQVVACQQKEMSCRFNLWISDVVSWAGQFNPSVLPVYQVINWIQYSRYTPGAGVNGTNFTPEWRDDFDSFNSSRWSKGDWTFGGNLADLVPENIVVQNGYCILCLTRSGQTGFNGTVPEDKGTGIFNNNQSDLKITPLQDINHDKKSPLMMLVNGRSVSEKSPLSMNGDKSTSGILILRKNNEYVIWNTISYPPNL